MNQKRPDRTEWKESAICTKSWNNSVLQFVKVSDMCDLEAGFLHKCAALNPYDFLVSFMLSICHLGAALQSVCSMSSQPAQAQARRTRSAPRLKFM